MTKINLELKKIFVTKQDKHFTDALYMWHYASESTLCSESPLPFSENVYKNNFCHCAME